MIYAAILLECGVMTAAGQHYRLTVFCVWSVVFEDSKLSFHKHSVVFLPKNFKSINPTSKNQWSIAFRCGMWYVIDGM